MSNLPLFETLADLEIKALKAKLIEKNEEIAELEDREKHLLQVIYNVSKVSFIEGACYQKSDFHNEAVNFAKSMQANQLKEGGK